MLRSTDLRNTPTSQYEMFAPIERRERPIYAAHNRILSRLVDLLVT